MRINKNTLFTTLLALFLSASIFTNTAMADDDVAAIVVDNGPTVSVPEPSTLGLMLAGIIGVGLVAYRNRKK